MRRGIFLVALVISICGGDVLLFPQTQASSPASSDVERTPMQIALQHLLEWRRSRVALADDWGELQRYREDNKRLAALPAEHDRIVFFGDSITDYWDLDHFFPGKPYVNRGISGQTTPQMIVRFREDVIALHPRAVVILAGTNDIAGNTGPMPDEEIEANLASMAELAKAHNVQVIFGSITPVHNFTPSSQDLFYSRPQEHILVLNKWLKAYCTANGLTYVDYYSAMVGPNGMLKRELADDGLHPNDAGYRVMADVVSDPLKKLIAMK